jgi:hypothetical protein
VNRGSRQGTHLHNLFDTILRSRPCTSKSASADLPDKRTERVTYRSDARIMTMTVRIHPNPREDPILRAWALGQIPYGSLSILGSWSR